MATSKNTTAKAKKFTPRASSNLIEGEVTDTATPVVTPEELPDSDVVEVTDESPNEGVSLTVDETPVDEVEDTSDDSDKVETSDETPDESDTEETTKTAYEKPEITFTAETEKKPIEKKVKVHLAKDYRGCIGGEWYYLYKDRVYTVPENVKRVLSRAEGMLKPL